MKRTINVQAEIQTVMSSDAPVKPQASILMVTIEMMKKSDNQIIVLEKSMFSWKYITSIFEVTQDEFKESSNQFRISYFKNSHFALFFGYILIKLICKIISKKLFQCAILKNKSTYQCLVRYFKVPKIRNPPSPLYWFLKKIHSFPLFFHIINEGKDAPMFKKWNFCMSTFINQRALIRGKS